MLLITPHVESNLQLIGQGYLFILLLSPYKSIIDLLDQWTFYSKLHFQCRRYFTPPSTPLVFDKDT